jgi:hypothetical protein
MSYTSTTSKSKSAREVGEEIRHADPIEVFTARCQARALLFTAGELDLQSAVDVLQIAAESTGLVTLLGQDRVQELMARAFALRIEAIESEASAPPANEPYHLVSRDGVASTAQMQRAYDRTLARLFDHRPPTSTVDALHYILRQNDPERLRRFIAARRTQTRNQIRAHLK